MSAGLAVNPWQDGSLFAGQNPGRGAGTGGPFCSLATVDRQRLAGMIEQRLECLLERAQITSEQLSETLTSSNYLLGHLAGIVCGGAVDAGLSDEPSINGLISMVIGNCLGGGLESKVLAHELVKACVEDEDFEDGKTDGFIDWCAQTNRMILRQSRAVGA